MPRAVGIHGIAQEQLGRHQLRAGWDQCLRDGLELALGRNCILPSLDIAYYGDLFLSKDDQGLQVYKGSEPYASEASLVSPTVDELRFLEIAVAEVESSTPYLGEPMGAGIPGPLQPLVRRLSRHLDARFVLRFIGVLRQVHQYQTNEILAETVRARLRASIGDGCAVVLAHSLGSVVAAETLSLDQGLDVGMLVTFGSPLGMASVCHALRADIASVINDDRGRRTWANIFDPADPVACAGALSPRLPAILDYNVNNGDDPHAINRYLSKRITGEIVAMAMAQSASK